MWMGSTGSKIIFNANQFVKYPTKKPVYMCIFCVMYEYGTFFVSLAQQYVSINDKRTKMSSVCDVCYLPVTGSTHMAS